MEYLDSLDEYVALRDANARIVRDGYFWIAKARYEDLKSSGEVWFDARNGVQGTQLKIAEDGNSVQLVNEAKVEAKVLSRSESMQKAQGVFIRVLDGYVELANAVLKVRKMEEDVQHRKAALKRAESTRE